MLVAEVDQVLRPFYRRLRFDRDPGLTQQAPPAFGRVIDESEATGEAPEDEDVVGVWRYAALGVPVAGSLHALIHLSSAKGLNRPQRAGAALVAVTYFAGGWYAVWRPGHLGTLVQTDWRRTLALCWLPLPACLLTGGGDSPLSLLAIGGVGATSAVYGRTRGRKAAATGALSLIGLNAFEDVRRVLRGKSRSDSGRWWQDSQRRRFERRYVIPVTAMFAAAEAASHLTSAAYNARNFDFILKQARRHHDELRDYREALREPLRDASAALTMVAAEPAFTENADSTQWFYGETPRELLLQAAGRLHEWQAAIRSLDAADNTVKVAIFRLIAVFQALDPLAERIEVGQLESWTERPLSELVSPAVAGLLGATLAAGLANALRHGHKPAVGRTLEAIKIRPVRRDGRAGLEVLTDVRFSLQRPDVTFPDGTRGQGLRHLHREAALYGGTLRNGWIGSVPDAPDIDRHRLVVDLPARAYGGALPPSDGPAELVADRVLRQIDTGLRDVTRIFAGLAAVRTLPALPRPPWSRRVRAGGPVAVTAVYFGLEHLRRLVGKEGRTLAAATSAAMFLAPADSWGPITGWATIALTRYGLRTSPHRLAVAITGPTVATLASLRHRDEHPREPALSAIFCVAAPIAGWLTMTLKTRQFVDFEQRLSEDLAATERTLELADNFRKAHSATEPMQYVADQLPDDHPAGEALRASLQAIKAAESHLPPEPSVPDLVDELARIVRRRVWPARVVRSYDGPALSIVLPEQISGRVFRHGALRIMDVVARDAMRRQMGAWRGFQERRALRVHFYCPPASRTILCYVSESQAEAERPPRRGVWGWQDRRRLERPKERPEADRQRLAEDIRKLGGELRWSDPEGHAIKFALPQIPFGATD